MMGLRVNALLLLVSDRHMKRGALDRHFFVLGGAVHLFRQDVLLEDVTTYRLSDLAGDRRCFENAKHRHSHISVCDSSPAPNSFPFFFSLPLLCVHRQPASPCWPMSHSRRWVMPSVRADAQVERISSTPRVESARV